MRPAAAGAAEGAGVRRVVVSLVAIPAIGVAVNVGIAWGCVLSVTGTQQGGTSATDAQERWWRAEAPPAMRAAVPTRASLWTGFGYEGLLLLAGDPPDGGVATRVRGGWPMPAVESVRWLSSSAGIDRTHGFLRLPIGRRVGRAGVPIRPLPAGFALNTLLYGLLIWGPLSGPAASRRFVRLRRGRCPHCGYPMGRTPVCSECGRRLPDRPGLAA